MKQKNNKIIAEFMGWEKSIYPNLPNKMYKHDPYGNGKMYKENFSIGIAIELLNYHSNWELLMLVIEKIESIQLPSPSLVPVTVSIKGNSCRIFKGEWNDDKEGFISYVSYEGNDTQYSKIEATYLAVIEFINWYNEQENE